MKKPFSDVSIRLSRPIIEEVFSSLEYHLKQYPNFEKNKRFMVFLKKPTWPNSELSQALAVISTWLNPKLFKTSHVDIVKLSPKAKWSDVLKILDKKLQSSGSGRFITIKDGYLHKKDKFIDFPNPNEDYVEITKFLIQHKEPLCTYKTLKTEFGKKGESEPKAIKKIHNALVTLYRNRKKQKVPFPRVAPGGRKIFEIEDGVGIRIYNPDL